MTAVLKLGRASQRLKGQAADLNGPIDGLGGGLELEVKLVLGGVTVTKTSVGAAGAGWSDSLGNYFVDVVQADLTALGILAPSQVSCIINIWNSDKSMRLWGQGQLDVVA